MLAMLMNEHFFLPYIKKSIYEHAAMRRSEGFPAGPDVYRSIQYERNDDPLSLSSNPLFTLRTL